MKGEITRASILAQAEQQGIKTDTASYSIQELAAALKALPQLQQEFRQLLSQFVDDSNLTSIEGQEKNIYRQVWHLWYIFATQPQCVIPKPHILIEQAAEIIKRIRKILLKEFRSLLPGGIQVRIVSEKTLWDFKPALWLTIDSDDALTVYETFRRGHSRHTEGYPQGSRHGVTAIYARFPLAVCS